MVSRSDPPIPWSEGEKIPWNDPAFSERMLREHLSQLHDGASRRTALIDAHVDWIHRAVLDRRPTRILDLGCGPGLYTSRLAARGHDCTGIDFSPASIAYARASTPSARYIEHDIRTADYGDGYGLAMLIFGELNVFRAADALNILMRTHAALCDDGLLLLEAHPYSAVRAMGDHPATWRSSHGGLFSPHPHLLLEEACWNDDAHVATHRYFVIDAATADVTRYAESMQAYTDDEYRNLLATSGFRLRATFGSLTGTDERGDLFVIVAERALSS